MIHPTSKVSGRMGAIFPIRSFISRLHTTRPTITSLSSHLIGSAELLTTSLVESKITEVCVYRVSHRILLSSLTLSFTSLLFASSLLLSLLLLLILFPLISSLVGNLLLVLFHSLSQTHYILLFLSLLLLLPLTHPLLLLLLLLLLHILSLIPELYSLRNSKMYINSSLPSLHTFFLLLILLLILLLAKSLTHSFNTIISLYLSIRHLPSFALF